MELDRLIADPAVRVRAPNNFRLDPGIDREAVEVWGGGRSMNRIVHAAMAASLALAPVVACDRERVAEPNLAPAAGAGGGGTYHDHDGSGVALVRLDGSGSLDPDGTITGNAWTEKDSSLANGESADVTLTLGRHSIVLTVTDDEGESDSDAVIVTVEYRPLPNTPPVVTILSPTPGEVFDDDQTITFSGTAVDAEEGALFGNSLSGILIPQVLSDHEPVGWGGNEFSQEIGMKVLPAWIADGAPDNGPAADAGRRTRASPLAPDRCTAPAHGWLTVGRENEADAPGGRARLP